jgi:hypothetical protein
MRTWIKATLGLIAFPIMLVFSLSGCQNTLAGVIPAGDTVYCTVMADPPVKAGSTIKALGRFRCDGKGADTIRMTVTFEKKSSSGVWKKVKSKTFTAHGANTSRDRSEGTRTRTINIGCAKGWFRTVVHSVETSNHHTRVVDTHSVGVPNPCQTAF